MMVLALLGPAHAGDAPDLLAYLYAHEDWDSLVTETRRALFLAPDPRAELLLASAYGQVGRTGEAMALLGALDDGPARPWVLLQRAELARSDDPWLAMVWLQRHQAEFPGESAPWRDGAMARLHLAVGDLDGAWEDLRRTGRGELVPAHVRRRQPWVGIVSSALLPGLGQLLAAQPVEAASALSVNAALGAGTLWAVAEDRPGTAAVVGAVWALFWAGNVYGGGDAAVRFNRRQRDQVLSSLDEAGLPGSEPPPVPPPGYSESPAVK